MSEPRVSVPALHRAAFGAMAELPTERLEVLAEAVGSGASAGSRSDIVAAVQSAGFEDAERWVAALMSASATRVHFNWSATQMATALAESADLKAHAATVRRLLSIEGLSLVAKVTDLATSYKHVLNTARIVTDIRPIFDEDKVGPPAGAIVVHTLEMSYSSDDGIESVFIVLDEEDIALLSSQILRAQDKARELDALVSGVGLRRFNVSGDGT